MFNFDKAISATQATLNDTSKLELLLMGPSGAGKSYTIGTLGVKTLYLYAMRETHGPKTAKVSGNDNIIPICIDYGTWGDETSARAFTADESLQFVRSILTSFDWIKKSGFEAIALDGIAALEVIVKETSEWKKKCLTTQGKHNTFKESEASQEIIGGVVNLLKGCQRELGVHIVATAMLDVKDMDGFGGISEAAPKLQGYGVCEAVVANFGDVLVVGKMTKGTDVKWKFQSLLDIKKVSKEENGTIKKILNFSPRLSGAAMPSIMDADLSKVVKMKRGDK
jgi:hypothetical protein